MTLSGKKLGTARFPMGLYCRIFLSTERREVRPHETSILRQKKSFRSVQAEANNRHELCS